MAGFFKKLFTKFSRSSRIDWEELEAELVAADIGIRRARGIADQLKESKGLDAENLVESTREVPVSYTHLDVYKRQGKDSP